MKSEKISRVLFSLLSIGTPFFVAHYEQEIAFVHGRQRLFNGNTCPYISAVILMPPLFLLDGAEVAERKG
jgi:hypothetical protein